MHITPRLTAAAEQRWLQIPEQFRERILSKVYCRKCPTPVLITEAEGKLDGHGDIILHGRCADCGGRVCRLIEAGEAGDIPT